VPGQASRLGVTMRALHREGGWISAKEPEWMNQRALNVYGRLT
jgi:hypothetical protein